MENATEPKMPTAPAQWDAWLRAVARGGQSKTRMEEMADWLRLNAVSAAERAVASLIASDAANHLLLQGLLDCGANPIIADEDGGTALIGAAQFGDIDSVRLLAPLSDAAATDARGDNALMHAAWAGRSECVRFLALRCDPLARNIQGMTALMHAAQEGRVECVEALLSKEAAAAVSDVGRDALMVASMNGRPACVKALLPWSEPNRKCKKPVYADFSASDPEEVLGWTALMIAAGHGHVECMNLLLPESDAGAQDHNQRTPLIVAAYWGQLECLAALLPFSDANAVDKGSRTALMVAARMGHVECVKALLARSERASEVPGGVSDESGLRDAFAEARRKDRWGCMDALAATVSMERLREVVEAAPADKMPWARAMVEREALALSVGVEQSELGDLPRADGDAPAKSRAGRLARSRAL